MREIKQLKREQILLDSISAHVYTDRDLLTKVCCDSIRWKEAEVAINGLFNEAIESHCTAATVQICIGEFKFLLEAQQLCFKIKTQRALSVLKEPSVNCGKSICPIAHEISARLPRSTKYIITNN